MKELSRKEILRELKVMGFTTTAELKKRSREAENYISNIRKQPENQSSEASCQEEPDREG